MANAVSLTRFISIRLFVAALVICVLWYFVARDLYLYALDSTSAYYLFEDGHHASQLQQQNQNLQSLNTTFKQFYTEFDGLPEDIRVYIDTQGLVENEVAVLATDEEDIYVLPYRETGNSALIYVVHRFATQATQDVSPVLLLLSFCVLLLMFVFMGVVIVRLRQQAQILSKALVAAKYDESDIQSEGVAQFDIAEFQSIYNEVISAYQQRVAALEREKQYSAFLSHEIRHSLASVNANIEKLDQIDGFPLAALPPMEDAKKHSIELQRIANAILALWQTNRLNSVPVKVAKILNTMVTNTDLGDLDVVWDIQTPEMQVQSDPDLFHLLLRQLLQNAKQYGNSTLTLILCDNTLQLRNDVIKASFSKEPLSTKEPLSIKKPISTKEPSSPSAHQQSAYGHQVGLHLIEKIVATHGWTLSQQRDQQHFQVSIRFTP